MTYMVESQVSSSISWIAPAVSLPPTPALLAILDQDTFI